MDSLDVFVGRKQPLRQQVRRCRSSVRWFAEGETILTGERSVEVKKRDSPKRGGYNSD